MWLSCFGDALILVDWIFCYKVVGLVFGIKFDLILVFNFGRRYFQNIQVVLQTKKLHTQNVVMQLHTQSVAIPWNSVAVVLQ